MKFCILLPVHRSPEMLPFAIQSVLDQEQRDFELFIICDGAPEATAECARRYAAMDSRIKVMVHPKGQRNGELYRHAILKEIECNYVCQIADDDLWFPNHLTEMEILLKSTDFGHVLQAHVNQDNTVHTVISNLENEYQRMRMCHEKFNTFGPTACGYRLSAYRQLETGWSPAPEDIWSDLFMWRKFFNTPGLTFATHFVITSLHFPTSLRGNMTLKQRTVENEAWFNKIQNGQEQKVITQILIRSLIKQVGALEDVNLELHATIKILIERAQKSILWKLYDCLRKMTRRIRQRPEQLAS